jgi:outer membrane protein assembly factor BamB
VPAAPQVQAIEDVWIMAKKALLSIVVMMSLFGVEVQAGHWPHWRGPFLNGSANEKNLPGKLSLDKNVKWVSSLPGHSSATPVVCKGRVFVSSTDKESKDLLGLCFDAKTGKELWRKKLGTATRTIRRNNMATPSPVTDGDNVYFMYGTGELTGLSYDGDIIWTRNIEADYGSISTNWGYSSSPLIYDDKLYILVQRGASMFQLVDEKDEGSKSAEPCLLAIDPKTGKNIWKQPRKTDAIAEALDAYSSPIAFQNAGQAEIITIGADYVISNDADTGRELWRYEYSERKIRNWRVVPSPVAAEGLIYGVQPRGGNDLFVIKLDNGSGRLSKNYVTWTFSGPTPDVSTPLYYKGSLYVLDGQRSKTVTCLDAKTSHKRWHGDIGGSGPWRASLTAADDKIYCINESSEVIVIAADPVKFQILSRIDLEDPPVQASIAIAEGHLFIRTAGKLFCMGI